MKRGIVMEAGKKWVTVLTPEGEFCRIRNNYGQYLVGQEIFFIETASQSRWRGLSVLYHSAWKEWGMTAALFVILLLLFIPLLQSWLNPRVVAYVSVDINPSIEIGIDKNFRVIEAYAYNPEGERILAAIPWKGEALATVTSSILDEADKQGYFSNSNQVLISTIPVALPNERSKQQITEQIDQVVQQRKSLHVVTVEGNPDIHDKAKNEGLSPGKYVIWQALQDSGVDMTREQIKKQSLTSIELVAGDINKVLELVNGDEVASLQPKTGKNERKDNNAKDKHSKDNKLNNKKDDNKSKDDRKSEREKGKKNEDNSRTVSGKRTHSPSTEVRIPSNEGWNTISKFLERQAKDKKDKQRNQDGKKKENQKNNDEGASNNRSHKGDERKIYGQDDDSQRDGKKNESHKHGESGKSGKNEMPIKTDESSKPGKAGKPGESGKPGKPGNPGKHEKQDKSGR